MNTNYAIRKIAEMIQTDKITVVKSDLSRNFTDKEMADMTLGQLCNVYRLQDFIPVVGWDALSGSNDKDILIEVDRALMERLDAETDGGRTTDDFVRYVQTIITEGAEFVRKAKINMGVALLTDVTHVYGDAQRAVLLSAVNNAQYYLSGTTHKYDVLKSHIITIDNAITAFKASIVTP